MISTSSRIFKMYRAIKSAKITQGSQITIDDDWQQLTKTQN